MRVLTHVAEVARQFLRDKGWKHSCEASFWHGTEMWSHPDDEDRTRVYILGDAYVEQLERDIVERRTFA